MNNIELIFEDKFNSANISRSSKYMVLSKNKITTLYDFKNKTKLCEFNSKNVINSVFSENEQFIALQKSLSIDIYDLADHKKIKSFLIGECCAQCMMYENKLIYPYNKNLQSSVVCYDLTTQKKEILFSQPYSNICSFDKDDNNIIAIFHTTNSDIFTVVKIDMNTKTVKTYTYDIPGHGVNAVAYSSYMKKLYVIQKNAKQNNCYNFISINLDTNEKTKIKSYTWRNGVFLVKTCKNKLYLIRMFTTLIIDLHTGAETEISQFPIAQIGICDNSDYFYVYNGEYISLYKYINEKSNADSMTNN